MIVHNATVTDPAQKLTALGTNADAAETPEANKNPAPQAYAEFKNQITADSEQNAQALTKLADANFLSTDGTAPNPRNVGTLSQLTTEFVLMLNSWQDVLNIPVSLKESASFRYKQVYDEDEYTVAAGGLSHQLPPASMQAIFNNSQWKNAQKVLTEFKLTPTYTDNGSTYYLAGYGIFQGSNWQGKIQQTSQIYSFTTGNALQEFVQNGLKLSGDPSHNTYVAFYYLKTPDYSQMIPVPVPAEATRVAALTTPVMKLAPVAAYDLTATTPAPVTTDAGSVKGIAFLAGTAVKPELQSPTGIVPQAPTITLNPPKAPPTTPEPPKDPGTPATPGDPGTPASQASRIRQVPLVRRPNRIRQTPRARQRNRGYQATPARRRTAPVLVEAG